MIYCNTAHNTLQSIYLICCIYLRSIHMITSNHWSLWISDYVSWVSCTFTPQTHRVRSVIPPGQSGPSLTERCRRDAANTRCSPKKTLDVILLYSFTSQFLTVNVGAIISWKTVELDDHSLFYSEKFFGHHNYFITESLTPQPSLPRGSVEGDHLECPWTPDILPANSK